MDTDANNLRSSADYELAGAPHQRFFPIETAELMDDYDKVLNR